MNGGSEISSGHVQRGLVLKEQRRYAEAENYFREALAQNPRDAFAFHQLAACQFQMDGRERDALHSIDEAIALEPNDAAHHALKAFILCALSRAAEALRSARAAVELAPDSPFVFTAEAQAFLLLEKWRDAEAAARRALALDAEDETAANQLAQALRLQNKMAENAEQIAGMLARDPENAYTHASAGWAALQRGEHRVAEQHFMEALRLDPGFETAREGLLQSFRARSPLYRAYLSYCFAMQRLSGRARWGVIIGLYLGVKFSRVLFTGSFAPIGVVIAVIYALFVFWVWVARGVGNFILLFDRFAKHALRRGEKAEAWFVGGGLLLGLLLVIGAVCTDWMVLLFPGIALCAAAIPFSLTWTNPSKFGGWIFGTVAVFMLLSGLAMAMSAAGFLAKEIALGMFTIALPAVMLSTWLGNVSALRK